jgi:hypothetical protein
MKFLEAAHWCRQLAGTDLPDSDTEGVSPLIEVVRGSIYGAEDRAIFPNWQRKCQVLAH